MSNEPVARAAKRTSGRSRSPETRDRILQAGITLISERGLHGVTVEQITQRADVGKGTFFSYFAGKEALLHSFGAIQAGRLEQALTAGSLPPEPGERVRDALVLLAEHPDLTPELARALFVACLAQKGQNEEETASLWRVHGMLAAMVREGQEARVFRTDLSAEEAALFALGQFFLSMLSWCAGYTAASLPEAVQHNVGLALDALSRLPGG